MAVEPSALEDVEFFKILGDEDRHQLAAVVDLIKLADGETLFRTGDPGESLFLVRAGEVELYVRDKIGRAHV